MIEWPEPKVLDPVAQENIERFRGTGAALELEEDEATWSFVSWARMPDPPYRMMLRNEQTREEMVFSMDGSGIWLRRKNR